MVRDPLGEDGKKVYAVKSSEKRFLLEYANRTLFTRDTPTRNYTLPYICTVRNPNHTWSVCV